MPRYMLDTDTSSYIMKRSNDSVLRRLKKTLVSDVCISVITKAELLFGVEMSPRRPQDQAALGAFFLLMLGCWIPPIKHLSNMQRFAPTCKRRTR